MELKEIKEEMNKILSQSDDPQIAILKPLLLLLFEMIEDLNKQTAELTLTLQQRQEALKELNKNLKKIENTKVNGKKQKTPKTSKKISSSSKLQEDHQ
ncbi:MAG: hypothetical protein UHG91_09830 [Succinivibrionaceae bacterium]|nr:hypothetical protein [Ruminobacter sp.]MDY5779568.1 hypothetical protein [Succinivibrionaceae bacterium]MEE1341050.1 hypothetical protein [Succinivibrionaceae bacterium]